MKDETKRAKVLHMSKMEARIYEALTTKPIGVGKLAHTVDYRHTSLYRPLARLHERGLVEKVTYGTRTKWRRVPQESVIAAFTPVLFAGIGQGSDGLLHPEFHLHAGREALVAMYFSISEKRGVRILGIQSNKSIAAALGVLTVDELVRVNERIKEQDIIIEGIVQEGSVDFYAAELKRRGMSTSTVFASFGGRTAETTCVPKEYLNFSSEILIAPNRAYIIDWQHLSAVEIRHAETVGLLRDMFALSKVHGTKVDQNVHVMRYLA